MGAVVTLRAYVLVDAQLQVAILNDVNAVVGVTRLKESLSLVQLDQHHVTTQLQENRLLEVAQHPGYNTRVVIIYD